jgi:hypothetical protein
MGGEATSPLDTRVRTEIERLMSPTLRAKATGAFLFKILRDAHPILLYDVYLLQRKGLVTLLKETMRPDSMAHGLSDKDLEIAWETFELNMQALAKSGANLRKRFRRQ